jgi:flagellin-like hook-associated protein FlgL
MSISIQGASASQLATLDLLTNQAGGSAGPGAAQPPTPAGGQADPAAIIDLGGAAPQLVAISSGFAASASLADAAVAAGSTIESLLAQMRQDAVSASDPGLDSDSRAALDAGFKANLDRIRQAIASAGVDGVNLIDGSVSGPLAGSTATLTGVDLSLGGPVVGLGADASLSDPAAASDAAAQVGDAVDKVGRAVDQIAAQGQAIESHLSVVAQAGLSLSPSVAGGVNGGLDDDGARLAALQVQQQLSLSDGGVANQGPSAILALFQAA